ncbi:MAG: DUF1573 domain-containing protein [Planctomycetaceae bacterium]|jgi:hypothetical protein|nr:DUF1573 domain-containing protein [Planctomycetaceae bacterium]MDG2389621.1 DUF1573 domain-containing protein [Planctomycetaceae bacterium]
MEVKFLLKGDGDMFAIYRCLIILLVSIAVSSSVLQAQELDWAAKMFEKQKVDFGVVARAAETKYRLKLKNIYQEDVHISNVRTTCGCSAASPSKTLIKSAEEAYIEIQMDTEKFMRRKDSNVVITFDAPTFAEVRIPITAYIRTDVVISPGAAKFGAVAKGEENVKTLDIAYAGRPDWNIKEVKSPRDYLTAEVVEISRDENGGLANYKLKVTLKANAPAGLIREQVMLITDDANSPQVPVLVEAKVESAYTVTPEIVSLGTIKAGEEKSFRLVVKGRKPFALESVKCESEYDGLNAEISETERTVHVVPVILKAPANPGSVEDQLLIAIVGEEEPIKVRMYGEITE